MYGSEEDEGPRIEDMDEEPIVIRTTPRPLIEQLVQCAIASDISKSQLLSLIAFICSDDDTYKVFMKKYRYITYSASEHDFADIMGYDRFGHVAPLLKKLAIYGDLLPRVVEIYKSKQQELAALIEQESHLTQTGGFRKRRNSKYARRQHKRKSKKPKTRKNVRRRYLK